MKYGVGIDLGSTTTKAVILGLDGQILGRGITNSRSNYDVACQVALSEALIDTRFSMVGRELEGTCLADPERKRLLVELELLVRLQQYRRQLGVLQAEIERLLDRQAAPAALRKGADRILGRMQEEAPTLYREGARRKSDFFRDLAGSVYLRLAEPEARAQGVAFDALVGLFDKAVLEVENSLAAAGRFEEHALAAVSALSEPPKDLEAAVQRVAATRLEQVGSVGTGYGRARLPFPKSQIRSEILCHGRGAHALFPETRTVLDIGGQDTKAIQVDETGVVTSFQMNDRCAAGCGRYLGYIADEMNLGVHELGPIACQSERPVRISSTCTVFAGAELRERLSLGDRREDILAGLHRAMILRAMSLLARSGGVSEQFTFTGGVANNPAAVRALRQLIRENYGEITINISPQSIYTGALGAALFALREAARADAEEPQQQEVQAR